MSSIGERTCRCSALTAPLIPVFDGRPTKSFSKSFNRRAVAEHDPTAMWAWATRLASSTCTTTAPLKWKSPNTAPPPSFRKTKTQPPRAPETTRHTPLSEFVYEADAFVQQTFRRDTAAACRFCVLISASQFSHVIIIRRDTCYEPA